MDQQDPADKEGKSSDFRTSSDDLKVQDEQKIVEPLSLDDHIRMHDAGARRKREAMLTWAGLAILLVIAIGCFGVFIFSIDPDKIKIAAQLMTMTTTAVIGFLFSKNNQRSH